jgi:O-antigen/teichoic acid export membrane protein
VSADESGWSRTASRALRLAILTFIVIGGVYALIGKPFFLLILGETARPAWTLSLMLIVVSIIHALTRITSSIAAGVGRPRLNLVALVGEIATLLVLVPFACPAYGVVGLAASSAAGALAALLIGTVQLCRIMHVSPAELWVPTLADLSYLRRHASDRSRQLLERLGWRRKP